MSTARFYPDSKHNPRKSEKEGRPIYDDIVMVEIRPSHDTHTVFCVPASEKTFRNGRFLTYAEVFAKEYEKFKAGQDQRESGTPLERMGSLTPAMIAECQSIGIYNVETLADLTTPQSKRLGFNGPHLRQAAEEYLEAAKTLVDKREKDAMQAQIDELKAMLAEVKGGKDDDDDEDDGGEGGDEFTSMSVAELKNAIKMLTGKAPTGNPKKATLVKQAREAAAVYQSENEAA